MVAAQNFNQFDPQRIKSFLDTLIDFAQEAELV